MPRPYPRRTVSDPPAAAGADTGDDAVAVAATVTHKNSRVTGQVDSSGGGGDAGLSLHT